MNHVQVLAILVGLSSLSLIVAHFVGCALVFTARCACFGSSVCVGMHCFHCMGFPTLVPPNSDSSRELPYQFRHRGFPINSVPEVFLVSLSDGYFLVGVSSVRRTAVDPKSFALSLFSCWVLLVQGICPFVCVLVSLTM